MLVVANLLSRKFNAAWKIKLDEKRVIEMNVEKEQRAKAAEELSTFSSQRDIKLKAKKESNQNAEKVFVESVTKDLASTQVWDRVTKLIDVNAVEKAEDSSKSDVSRMRKLFIHLKNEPVAAK